MSLSVRFLRRRCGPTTVPPTTEPPPTVPVSNASVVVSPASPVVGTPVTITASFSGYFDWSGRLCCQVNPIGSVAVNQNGQAVLRKMIWSLGTITVTARYDDSLGHGRTTRVSVNVLAR